MKLENAIRPFFSAVVATVLPCCALQGGGPSLPQEAKEQIHLLFENHASIRRETRPTADGYTALTESDDPKVAAALKKHVRQMEERLGSGLAVRRWDPAFAEYVAHYKDMEHQFSTTEKGVRMTIKGKTLDAVKVARNHAAVISAFVAHGWKEQSVKHGAVTR